MTPAAPRIRALYELEDALSQLACPICSLGERAAHRYVDMFLYENVNDVEIRAKLRQGRGLCGPHTRLLARYRDALGVSIVYEDLLGTFAADLAAPRPRARGTAAWRVTCPVCQEQEAAEERLLSAFVAGLRDPVFVERYQRAPLGLCLPHLMRALAQSPSDVGEWLRRDTARRIAAWRGRLREFIRKCDYRYQGEPVGEEGRAWLEVLRWAGGGTWDDPRETGG